MWKYGKFEKLPRHLVHTNCALSLDHNQNGHNIYTNYTSNCEPVCQDTACVSLVNTFPVKFSFNLSITFEQILWHSDYLCLFGHQTIELICWFSSSIFIAINQNSCLSIDIYDCGNHASWFLNSLLNFQ